jgi:hypothetical protein
MPETTKPATATPSAPVAPVLEVFGGRVKLNLAEVPLWGSPSAPQQLISLFDYTCSHCREMHERVEAVQKSFSNRLAVISLPMPLDAQCNTLIKRTHPKQINGCQYARLGLAVALAKPDAIKAYDDWVFATLTPPPLTEATNQAVLLVGAEALTRALTNALVEKHLAASMRIFEISALEYRNGNMPQFLIGTNIFSGDMTTEELREKVAPYVTAGPR